MPYNKPLGGTSRLLTPEIAIYSCPFSVLGMALGARMAAIKLSSGNLLVWSAVPYGPEAETCFTLLNPNPEISSVVVPNSVHTMAARGYAEQTQCAVIGSEAVNEASVTPLLGGKFLTRHANKVLRGKELQEILKGKDAEAIAQDFEFVYVAGHSNKELVMFHRSSKTIFEADLLLNVQPKSEQYGGANPTTGLSFLVRYLQPTSVVGNWLGRKMFNVTDERNQQAIAAIKSWNGERIVMCHGEIIEGAANVSAAFDGVWGALTCCETPEAK